MHIIENKDGNNDYGCENNQKQTINSLSIIVSNKYFKQSSHVCKKISK